MIELFNSDNSYFRVTSPDVQARNVAFNDYVTSISITEESGLGRLDTGSINLIDPDNSLTRVVRAGMLLNIEWGYINIPLGLPQVLGRPLELGTEAFGPIVRSNFQGIVQYPQGGGDENGSRTFSINFFSPHIRAEKKRVVFSNTNRGALVRKLFDALGISDPIIDFRDSTVQIGELFQEVQNETDYQMLVRLARQWNCVFRIGSLPSGAQTGVFADRNKIAELNFANTVTGARGNNYLFLNYKEAPQNVLSFTWKQNAGIEGGGDGVTISNSSATGKPIFTRTVIENETVRTYRFNPKRFDAAYARLQSPEEQRRFREDIRSARDFETVRKFFDPVEVSTAPQGYGYEINCKMKGNPLMTPPIRVTFGDGMPVVLTQRNENVSPNTFYCNKVTHNINRDGYFMDVQVLDHISANGGRLE